MSGPVELRSALRSFLDNQGRLTAFPAKRKKQLYALRYLAGCFVPGRTYTEQEINDLLDQKHTYHDPVTLRRELCDLGVLGRKADGSVYWMEPVQPTFPEEP